MQTATLSLYVAEFRNRSEPIYDLCDGTAIYPEMKRINPDEINDMFWWMKPVIRIFAIEMDVFEQKLYSI